MSWEGHHLYAFEIRGECFHEHLDYFPDNGQCREPMRASISEFEGKPISVHTISETVGAFS